MYWEKHWYQRFSASEIREGTGFSIARDPDTDDLVLCPTGCYGMEDIIAANILALRIPDNIRNDEDLGIIVVISKEAVDYYWDYWDAFFLIYTPPTSPNERYVWGPYDEKTKTRPCLMEPPSKTPSLV